MIDNYLNGRSCSICTTDQFTSKVLYDSVGILYISIQICCITCSLHINWAAAEENAAIGVSNVNQNEI